MISDTFLISEAKDHLKELSTSIRETRNKCWMLISGAIAINFFFFNHAITASSITHQFAFLLIASVVMMLCIAVTLTTSLIPTSNNFNGNQPDFIAGMSEVEIAAIYQKAITRTGNILNKMCDNFKNGLLIYLLWGAVSFFTIVLSKSVPFWL